MQGLVTQQYNNFDYQYWHTYNRSLEKLAEPKNIPSVKIRKKGKAFNTLIKTQEPFTNKIRGL